MTKVIDLTNPTTDIKSIEKNKRKLETRSSSRGTKTTTGIVEPNLRLRKGK